MFLIQGIGTKPEGSGGNGVTRGKHSVLPTFSTSRQAVIFKATSFQGYNDRRQLLTYPCMPWILRPYINRTLSAPVPGSVTHKGTKPWHVLGVVSFPRDQIPALGTSALSMGRKVFLFFQKGCLMSPSQGTRPVPGDWSESDLTVPSTLGCRGYG